MKKKHDITNDTDLIVDDDFDATVESLCSEEFDISQEQLAEITAALETKGKWKGKLKRLHPAYEGDKMEPTTTTIHIPTAYERGYMAETQKAIDSARKRGVDPALVNHFEQEFFGHKKRKPIRN